MGAVQAGPPDVAQQRGLGVDALDQGGHWRALGQRGRGPSLGAVAEESSSRTDGMATMADRAPRDVLDDLRCLRDTGQVAAVCEDLGIVLLVAFGNALDEGVAEPRDLDLAVQLEPDRDLPGVVASLLDRLGSSAIDVLDLARADVVARYESLAGGELLHERDPGTFDDLEIAAVLRMADTRWLRELRLEALGR